MEHNEEREKTTSLCKKKREIFIYAFFLEHLTPIKSYFRILTNKKN